MAYRINYNFTPKLQGQSAPLTVPKQPQARRLPQTVKPILVLCTGNSSSLINDGRVQPILTLHRDFTCITYLALQALLLPAAGCVLGPEVV
jgi:hypothetical protein